MTAAVKSWWAVDAVEEGGELELADGHGEAGLRQL
jgi:hypothetical protein